MAMLNLDGKTILTAATEKRFIEVGGADPEKIFDRSELGEALAKSIECVADAGRYDILERIYNAARKSNPDLPDIDNIDISG